MISVVTRNPISVVTEIINESVSTNRASSHGIDRKDRNKIVRNDPRNANPNQRRYFLVRSTDTAILCLA